MSNVKTCLTDGSPVTPEHKEIDPATGMQKGYVVLSPEERAKGYVRPVRYSYIHVGHRPTFALRDLTAEEKQRFGDCGYVKFEVYPESELPKTGRYWKQAELDQAACHAITVMSKSLAETYARDPKFYGATFCSYCCDHFNVNQFVWAGTMERVGS